MSFLFPSLLTAGAFLIGLPLAIHLINLRRRRRVEWGAMQFLLASQKRNKKWIILRQLLLLFLRTAAVGLAILMLAGPTVKSGWASLFGSGVTHHLILLDDSYSMSDQWNETSAFAEAKQAVGRLLGQVRSRADRQTVTLLKFSESRRLAAGAGPRFDRTALDAKSIVEIERYLEGLECSESSAGPVDALEAASRLPTPEANETRIAYLVSDFRRVQWNERSRMRQLVGDLRDRSSKLVCLQCVDAFRPNLAVTRLAPESGVRAAGIETWMELEAANYGDKPAAGVIASVEQDSSRLPAVEFDEIPPGESVTHRFRAAFAGAGAHQMTASLESDAVVADNRIHYAAQVPASFPILIIDASPRGDDGYFLSNALSPGGKNVAGWSPQVEPASFLRRHDELARFAAICLLDVPRLDEPEIEALDEYVRAGGGVAIFLGSDVQRAFYNERLYRDGEGLLPAPLGVPTQLLRDPAASASDIVVGDHPIFRVFGGQRNSFLSVAKVDFYQALEPGWKPTTGSGVNVLARLRNQAPFVIEKKLGAGRVVVQLAKLSPHPDALGAWSTWSINPAFPVYANELIGYLSSARRGFDQRTVEQKLELVVDDVQYLPDARVRSPGSADSVAVTAPAAIGGKLSFAAPQNPNSGVWQFDLKTRDGKDETRLIAVNVAPGEGDLHFLDRSQLAMRLRGVDYDFLLASQISETGDSLAGFAISDALLYALAAVLIAEQLLAVAASYHAPAAKAAA